MLYLNNAASSFPKPYEVIGSVNDFLARPPVEAGRSSGVKNNWLEEIRSRLAGFINAGESGTILFTSGATEGLNLVLNGIIEPGDHIVATMMEHNSVLRPLKHLEQAGIVSLTIVPADRAGRIDPVQIVAALNENTKAVIVTHSSNVTGTVQDVPSIGALLKETPVRFIVDAAQSAGVLPIDVRAWYSDAVVFTGHKFLFGLPGSGFIYLNPDLEILPLKKGGTGVFSASLLQPEMRPYRYEAGTLNYPGIVSMGAGVAYLEKYGVELIQRHLCQLRSIICNGLKRHPMIQVYGCQTEQPATAIAFSIGSLPADELGVILHEAFDISVRTGLHCAPLVNRCIDAPDSGTVRVSFSFLNTTAEVEYFVTAIDTIVRSML